MQYSQMEADEFTSHISISRQNSRENETINKSEEQNKKIPEEETVRIKETDDSDIVKNIDQSENKGIDKGEDLGDNESLSKQLFDALVSHNFDEANLLLEKGADNSYREPVYSQSPLHWACALGQLEIAQKLYNITNSFPESPLTTPLHRACMMSETEIIKWIISLPGIDVNQQDEQGFTALHWLCESVMDIETARLLLLKGASPSIQDSDGNTPLHIAAAYGHTGFTYEMAALEEGSLQIANEVRFFFVQIIH